MEKNAVYGNITLCLYKLNYTLRCLEYICSVSQLLRRHGLLIVKHTDKCTLNFYLQLQQYHL